MKSKIYHNVQGAPAAPPPPAESIGAVPSLSELYAIFRKRLAQIEQRQRKEFGLREYHDPELAARLREDAPEMELWDLIERSIDPGEEWTGSASDLEGKLQSLSSPVTESATRFFRKMGAAKLLGRLAGEMPGVVFRGRDKDKRWWCIKRPVAS